MKNNQFPGKKTIWLTIFLLVTFSSLLLCGCDQAEPEVYRVGILAGFDFPAPTVTDGFKDAMTELGYVEGENISYDLQETHSVDMQGYQDIVQKFIDDEVDLIFSFPTEASIVAKQVAEGSGVPVLFSFAGSEGLVEKVQAPGGNISGVRYPLTEIAMERLDVSLQLVPDAKKILIPFFTDYPILPPQFEAIAPLAEAAGVTIVQAPVTSGDEMQTFFDELLADDDDGEPDIDAILFLVGPAGVSPDIVSVVAQFSAEHQIPITSGTFGENDTWTITSINVATYTSGELAAPLAEKILQGIPAGTIPVVTPNIYMNINYTAAQDFGVTIPEGLLKQADEIFR
jgi:putative ABC transport system substrate-binding protein